MCITIQIYSFQVALYEYNLLSDLLYRVKMMMMMMIYNVETIFCESKLTDFMINYLTWCMWLRSAKEMNPLMAKLLVLKSKTSPKTSHNRELKQQRQRRLQKHHLKSEFAPLQTLSCLFHLVYFVKCWQMFLEFNSKRLYQSSGKEKKVVVLCSRPRQNVNSGIFTL